jgi:uncharacterized protein YmfQ (DUF2313 family)
LTRRHAHAAALADEADPDAALRRLMDFHRDCRLPDQQPPISVHTNHSRVPTVAWPTNRSASAGRGDRRHGSTGRAALGSPPTTRR